jgi:DNA adenine methylase
MKPMISYYGGKQNMASLIVGLIPKHDRYIEPFSGGAAVFFAKEPVKYNILNDKNKWLINMYIQYQRNPKLFCHLLRSYPFSERIHKLSKNYKVRNRMLSAIRFWYNINCSFSNQLDCGFKGSASEKNLIMYNNKLSSISEKIIKLRSAVILCRDAISIIKKYDSPSSFFYIDPPYPEANQGHYSGYSISDYSELISVLSSISGKFILSNYYQDVPMPSYWHIKKVSVCMSAAIVEEGCERENREELLIMNYKPLEEIDIWEL